MKLLMALLAFGMSWAHAGAIPLFDHDTYLVQPTAVIHPKGMLRDENTVKNLKKMQHISFKGAESVIPKKMDLSALVSLPENQGACGSCWDFSLSKALRSEFMIAGKDPGVLEFNYLLNNCGPGPHMYGCSGGSFDAALSFQNGAGPGLDALDPYREVQGSCKHLPTVATSISYAMLGNGYSGPSFKDLAAAVSKKHMVSIDVAAASGNWERYGSGVYNGCVNGNLDHMIDLVGYDCQSSVDSLGNCVFDSAGRAINKDELLLVQNNWGEKWGIQAENGHGGYMWTLMYGPDGSKCNGIASDALIFSISTPLIAK